MTMRLACALLSLPILAATAGEDTGSQDRLLNDFRSPPADARPTTWWRFMDDWVTREGITADLDLMKRVGLGGAVVSFCSSRSKLSETKPGSPQVPILSEPWWELTGFQLKEAEKRGLDLWFQACPGYATSGGPWIKPEHSMQKLVWAEVACDSNTGFAGTLPRPAVDKTWNYLRDIAVLAVPVVANGAAVDPHQVVDLTNRTDAKGHLKWKPEAGSWKIVRLGHTTTGKTVHPAMKTGTGLECDKLSRVATRIQFDHYFKKILDRRPPGTKGGIDLFFDSWEADNQNWTPLFREEFRKRRGYDPLPWVLIATGRTIGNEELSRRFDHDWKTTIEEMVNSEHFAELARLCHENGCRNFRAQPYNGPVNFMTAGALFDIPEGEFWHSNKSYGWWTLRMAASVGHINGRKIIAAESMTASPEHIRFDVDPFSTKAETDLALTMGINGFSMHVMPHNPWPGLRPGMTAGPYGMILSGGQSWADLADPWVTYLARCSHLLRQGDFVADVVTLFRVGQRGYEPPQGHAGDLCNEEKIISSMTWDGQALCLPGGMRYRLLELVDTTNPASSLPSATGSRISTPSGKRLPQTITPALLRKIRGLVHAGATVLGPRPSASAGLSGYPEQDREIAGMAEELWGPASGGPVDRKVGMGRVLSGITAADALARMKLEPDFMADGKPPEKDLPWIHRRLDEDDFYFISNQKDQPVMTIASFRIDGKIPDLWDPDTGDVEPAVSWDCRNGRTEVELELPARGSVFVRFHRGPAPSLPMKSQRPVVLGTLDLSKDWKLSFPAEPGLPPVVAFPSLASWTDRPEKNIRHYSGTAIYQKNVVIPHDPPLPDGKVVLDLGEVKNLARVTINGTTLPGLWKPPFACDITRVVKPGANRIQIEVANLWANRLIGDEQEAADVLWGPEQFNPQKLYKGRLLEAVPEWVVGKQPRPSKERRTFTTWNYVKKDQPLLASGLLGPARIVFYGK